MAGFLGWSQNKRDYSLFSSKAVFSRITRNEGPVCVRDNTPNNEMASVIPEFYVQNDLLRCFEKDTAFFENEKYVIVFDGVLLNSKELLGQLKQSTIAELLAALYEKESFAFLKSLRGSFCGLVYEKHSKTLRLFTDHIGSKKIYYASLNDSLLFGSRVETFFPICREAGALGRLNVNSAYCLLTYGYFVNSDTMYEGVTNVPPGTILTFCDGHISLDNYYRVRNEPDESLSENDAIEEVDRLFRQAIYRAFEKDREYGYKHCVSLSSGFDCRMTTWVAHEMGYGPDITNITTCQSGYYDEIEGSKMAAFLKHDWIFRSLDSGKRLMLIEENMRESGGAYSYIGGALSLCFFNLPYPNEYGLIHTGQLGDAILGTFFKSAPPNYNYSLTSGAYSTDLIDRIKPLNRADYENEEVFKIYTRAFNGADIGLVFLQSFTESYSPFYDMDLFNFALSVPLKYRLHQQLYKKWILEKYPQAAQFPHNGKVEIGLSQKQTLKILCKNTIKETARSGLKLFGLTPRHAYRAFKPTLQGPYADNPMLHRYYYTPTGSMNPLGYWYETNERVRNYMDTYYKEHIELLTDYPELKKDSADLYGKRGIIEKIAVLSLLGVMSVYGPR